MQNGTRQVYSVERGETVTCAVYDRMALRAGARIEGPAVIEEDESTAFIDAGGIATVDDGLNLIVTLPSATKRAASVSGRGNRRVPA
jgi:N-methylhydantoinase A